MAGSARRLREEMAKKRTVKRGRNLTGDAVFMGLGNPAGAGRLDGTNAMLFKENDHT